MRGHGEGQAHVHPARISLDRSFQKFFHLGKCDDFIEPPVNLAFAHAQDCAVEIDVLAP